MEPNYQEYDRYQRAKKQVEDIKEFYGHLVSYLAVNGFLLFINLRYSPETLWFYWPMLGWGLGLALHGMRVYNFNPLFSKDWEEKKLKQFMEEEKRNQHGK